MTYRHLFCCPWCAVLTPILVLVVVKQDGRQLRICPACLAGYQHAEFLNE